MTTAPFVTALPLPYSCSYQNRREFTAATST